MSADGGFPEPGREFGPKNRRDQETSEQKHAEYSRSSPSEDRMRLAENCPDESEGDAPDRS